MHVQLLCLVVRSMLLFVALVSEGRDHCKRDASPESFKAQISWVNAFLQSACKMDQTVFADEGPDHELVRVRVTILDALSKTDSFVLIVENCVVGGHEVETEGPHVSIGVHQLDHARVGLCISHIPLVSWDGIPNAVNVEGDVWDHSVLSCGATACSQSVWELFTNAVAEEVAHNSVVVGCRENVQGSSTVNNTIFSCWDEGKVTDSHVAELKTPEVV